MKLFIIVLLSILLSVNISYAYLNSTIRCVPNTTGNNTSYVLEENWTVYKDSNQTNLTIYTYCNEECDNQTMQCAPPKYQQSIIIAGVFVAIFALAVMGYRWLK